MTLKRELGLFGATMMGLGSIIGTGVFVSLGIAAGVAGPSVVIAIGIAAAVTTCNALSSAQLAANHPVSGGTYEYGYRFLKPWLGFAAGWMFLLSKTASAATAALGFSGYLLSASGYGSERIAPVAIGVVVLLTAIVWSGIRLSNHVNIAIVSVTLVSLAVFVAAGAPAVAAERLRAHFDPASLWHATALMFVAYTGYGRIATLGEEVVEPRSTIPRAILLTLAISMAVYGAVAVVAVGAAGAEGLAQATTEQAAPLEFVSRGFNGPAHAIVAVGAMTAMLGVLLNLILGLSRVLLAMGRRRDMPRATAQVAVAVLTMGAAIGGLAAVGSVKVTWSFSAFAVLIYYAVTNLAALQLTDDERLYSRWWPRAGLAACLVLAFAVEWQVWASGLGLLAAGLAWHAVRQRRRPTSA